MCVPHSLLTNLPPPIWLSLTLVDLRSWDSLLFSSPFFFVLVKCYIFLHENRLFWIIFSHPCNRKPHTNRNTQTHNIHIYLILFYFISVSLWHNIVLFLAHSGAAALQDGVYRSNWKTYYYIRLRESFVFPLSAEIFSVLFLVASPCLHRTSCWRTRSDAIFPLSQFHFPFWHLLLLEKASRSKYPYKDHIPIWADLIHGLYFYALVQIEPVWYLYK